MQKSILILLSALVLIAGGIFLYNKSQKSSAPDSSDLPGQRFSDLGNFYDWNLGNGPIAEKIRENCSETMIRKIGDGQIVMNLASNASFSESELKGIINLRDDVYWSDGLPFEAEHVLAAVNRLKGMSNDGTWTASDREFSLLSSVTPKVVSKYEIEFAGLRSQAEFEELLMSNILRPIRNDLLTADPSAKSWAVVIGKRKPVYPSDSSESLAILEFVPNTYYFKGAVKENESVALTTADSTGKVKN